MTDETDAAGPDDADGAPRDGADAAARPVLERRLGLRDAVVLGLGSMVGAGIFAAVVPAAVAAGAWLPLAVLVAGLVAWLNATSSGRLAAVHPQAGGTYAYATERLGRRWGHLAGWAFVTGKTASVAAMAATVGAYAAPGHARWAALAALGVVTVLGTGGIQRGARLTRGTLVLALVALALVVVASWAFPPSRSARAGAPSSSTRRTSRGGPAGTSSSSSGSSDPSRTTARRACTASCRPRA